jgi:hypothetical protein
MVGIELIALAAPRFLAFTGPGSSRNLLAIAVSLLTLTAMVGPTLWSEGILRLYPVLLGAPKIAMTDPSNKTSPLTAIAMRAWLRMAAWT